MALEKIKNFFGVKVDTEGFNTEQFVSVLQNNVPGSGYERIQKLRNGIAINQNKLTAEDQKLMNDLVDIAVEYTKVADSSLFKQQLETYICTGEIQQPESATDPVLHLDETMRVSSDVHGVKEPLSTESLKAEAAKLSKEANAFIEKINNESPVADGAVKSQRMDSLTEVDKAHIARAQNANDPHGFKEAEPTKRTGT